MKATKLNRAKLARASLGAAPGALALLASAAWMALAPSALGASLPRDAAPPRLPASATLEGCVTSAEQTERSVTFAGEMTAVKGAPKMQMRVDVLERMPGDLVFHSVFAPGLGIWRTSTPGVSSYKYLKEITNLAAPASYRAVVRFRWLSAKGHVVKAMELRTPRCVQSADGVPRPKAGEELASGSGSTPPLESAGQ